MICRLCRGTGRRPADDAATKPKPCPDCDFIGGLDFSAPFGGSIMFGTGTIHGPTPEPAVVDEEYGGPVG